MNVVALGYLSRIGQAENVLARVLSPLSYACLITRDCNDIPSRKTFSPNPIFILFPLLPLLRYHQHLLHLRHLLLTNTVHDLIIPIGQINKNKALEKEKNMLGLVWVR